MRALQEAFTDTATRPAKSGTYENIPAHVYHSWDAFSITTGLELLKSPGHYRYRRENPIEATPAMRLGTLVHSRLLEPELFKKTYVEVPANVPKDRRTKARKEWEDEFSAGREVIESADAEKIEGIFRAVMAKDCASQLLGAEGKSELSLLLKDEFQLWQKGRLDKYQPQFKTLVDIKTTRDASPATFAKTVLNNGYHVQAAHYMKLAEALGLELRHVVILAIETEAPYGVAVYQLPPEALAAGAKQREKLLALLLQCENKNDWQAYEDSVQTIEFPAWAFRD